jgi:hypothetical protein
MAGNLLELNPNQNKKVDVQNTTLSIDALGRFVCSTWDEATNLDFSAFDAVVIGSGMYGAYCATKIWRGGGKVLVLEAGPFLVSEHVQNLARIGLNVPGPVLPESQDGNQTRDLVWGIPWRGNQIFNGLAFCVGGKSLYWGGWSPRLTPDVLEEWPAKARDYLKDNYKKLEVQIGVSAQKPGQNQPTIETDFIDETGLTKELRSRVDAVVGSIPTLEKSETAPVAVQGQAPASGLFSFDKYSSGPILMDAIREDIGRSQLDDSRRMLFLVPKARVTRLGTENGTVNRIDVFVDNTFKSLPIPPTCKVILAASCIESTRLALESFPTPLMGRNLMVHLRSNVAVRVPKSAFQGLEMGSLETAATHVPGKTPQGGRYHLQIVAAANRNNNAEEVWFRMIPDTDILQGILKNQDSDYIALQLRSCGEMLGIKDQGSPSPLVSWIDLSPEQDEFGMRRAYVHLKTTSVDDELWKQMDEAMFTLAESIAGKENTEYWVNGKWVKERPPFGKLNTEGGVRDPLGTTYHECGTMWMGDDLNSSVTDSTGRFHHITNAYCVDQSVFARSGSANPVLTGLTVARHTAEAIANSGTVPLEPDFTPLFKFSSDDQPLPDDWEHWGAGGFSRLGNILETNSGIGLLWYKKQEFKDFILRVQWRSPTIDNNSGVYVRLPKPDANRDFNNYTIKTGYEIQIDNTGNRPGDASSFPEENFNPFHQTGAIYPVHDPEGKINPLPNPNGKPSKKIIPTKAFGQWNDYEITVQDNRIRVVLNGEEVLEGGDYIDTNNTYPSGYIALQNHFKGFQVQFRNIRIKPL